jgi:hypothetical protein
MSEHAAHHFGGLANNGKGFHGDSFGTAMAPGFVGFSVESEGG